MASDRRLTVDEIIERLRKSSIRPMFYKANGLPRANFMTNAQRIYEEKGIRMEHYNKLECIAINGLLRAALRAVRKEAQKSGINFIGVDVTHEEENPENPDKPFVIHETYHGFCQDIDKIDECIARYKSIAEAFDNAYEEVKHLGELQKRAIRQSA